MSPTPPRRAPCRLLRRLAAGAWLAAGAAAAAPLDALLTAQPAPPAARGFVEGGASFVNRSIDFSDPEDDPLLAAQSANGSYRDLQLAAGWRLRDGLWVTGGLWRRSVGDGIDSYRYLGWQLAGQTLLRAADGRWPALALRLGAWGNQASATETTTPVRVPGAILDSVTVRRPADRQLQADLVATWPLSPSLDFSALLSAGQHRLSYAGLTATTTRNGCKYDLQFNGNDIFGTLAAPCSGAGGVIEQFYDSSGDYGVDVANEIAWRGRFAQAGVNLRWRGGPWVLQAGYLYHGVRRDAVDDILRQRGRPVYAQNRIVALAADYAVDPRWTLLMRAQLGSNLFFSDVPVTYNSSTSGSFGSRLSLFTIGLRAAF